MFNINKFLNNKNKQKGITPIVTGITITLIAVLFMVIIINFAIPYFNTLQDLNTYKNNKQSLLIINEVINELSISEINSTKQILINPNNIIYFDSNNNKIIIEQEIKSNNFFKKIKDNLNYGNLNINKNNNNLIYTLNITNSKIFENIEILPNSQEIEFKIIGFENNKPTITIKRINNNNQEVTNFWYSESWPEFDSNNYWNNRIKIAIDKNLSETYFENIPLFIDINFNTSNDIDLNSIIFTAEDGITKLDYYLEDLEIYQTNSYYIEEYNDNNFNTWIKSDIPANTTKTIYIEKREGYIPNGNDVFLFFDDFEDNDLNIDKWQGETDYCKISDGELRMWGDNIEIYSKTKFGNNTILKTKLIQRSIGDFDSGVTYQNGNDDGVYTVLDTTSSSNSTIATLWWGSSYSTYAFNKTAEVNVWQTLELTKNNNNYISEWINEDMTREFISSNYTESYVGLACDQDSGETATTPYFDYVFLRKYSEIEPVVEVEELLNNRYKIEITNNNNEDLLDYQIKIPNDILNVQSKDEGLDLDSEKNILLKAWINIPKFKNNSNTILYLYYDNPNANIDLNSTKIWNNDTKFRFSFNEDLNINNSEKYNDSTINNNKLELFNFVNILPETRTYQEGQLNKSVSFGKVNSNNNYLKLENNSCLNNIEDEFTISAWIKSKNNYIGTGHIDKTNSLDSKLVGYGKASTYPKIINLKEDISVIAYQSERYNGKLRTVNIDVNGNANFIDEIIFEKSEILFNDIIKINNNYIGIVYPSFRGVRDQLILKTIEIDDSGNILGIVDQKIIDYYSSFEPSIRNVDSNIFLIVYRDNASGVIKAKTLEIDENGNISENIIDQEYFNEYSGYFNIDKVTDTVYALVHYSTSNHGWLRTFNVDLNGDISSDYISSYEFEPITGVYSKIHVLSPNVVIITYRDSSYDGWIETIEIDNNGTIIDTIDKYEFQPDFSYFANIIPLQDNIYTIIEAGSGNDGYIHTIRIDNNGSIEKNLIDSWEFDTSNAYWPNAIKINSDKHIFAIVKYGYSYNVDFLKTIEVNNDGTINKELISNLALEYYDDVYDIPEIFKLNDDLFVLEYYRRGDVKGILETYNIDEYGNISEKLNTLEFDSYGVYPQFLKISENIFAMTYYGYSTDGWIKTFSFDENGLLTNIDTLEYDTVYGVQGNITKVYNNIYAISYAGPDNDGYVTTLEILPDGQISDTIIDNYEFDTERCDYQKIIKISESANIFAITYRTYVLPRGYYGLTKTIKIDNNGTIYKEVIDNYNFSSNYYGYYPDPIKLSDNYFAVVYYGYSGDGHLDTYHVDNNGIITFIDEFEYDTIGASMPNIKKMINTENKYIIDYINNYSNKEVKILEIEDNGIINKNIISEKIINYNYTTTYNSNFYHMKNDIYITSKKINPNYAFELETLKIDSNNFYIGTNFKFSENTVENKILKIQDNLFAVISIDENSLGTITTFNTQNLGKYVDQNSQITKFNINESKINNITAKVIENNIIAITYVGQDDFGYIKTISINNEGTSIEEISNFKYNNISTKDSSFIKLDNNKYLISYTGENNYGYVTTLEINSLGNITENIIDNYNFINNTCYESNIIKINNNIFGIAYRGNSNEGTLDIIEVNENTGIITKETIDRWIFDDYIAYNPKIFNVNKNTFGIIYTNSSTDGYLITLNIDNNGEITKSPIKSDRFEYYYAKNIEIEKISNNNFIIVSDTYTYGGQIHTIEIKDNGYFDFITNQFIFDSHRYNVKKPTFVYNKNNYYLIAYSDQNNNGRVVPQKIITNNLIYAENKIKINTFENRICFNINNEGACAKPEKPIQWNYISATYNKNLDSNNLKFYINGELVGSKDIREEINITNEDLIIGRDFFGYVDELRLYNTEKSQSWLRTEYNNQVNATNNILVYSEQTFNNN